MSSPAITALLTVWIVVGAGCAVQESAGQKYFREYVESMPEFKQCQYEVDKSMASGSRPGAASFQELEIGIARYQTRQRLIRQCMELKGIRL